MATLDVDGMTCAVCVSRVEKAISSVNGVRSVSVNLATGIANFNGEADIEEVISAINNSGYAGSQQVNFFEKWNSDKLNSIRELKLTFFSLLYSLIAMYVIMNTDWNHTLFGLFSMSLVLILNRGVVIKGFRSLVNGLNMYTLVLLAFLSALTWSLLYLDDPMWEATFIVVAFVGFGDALESFAKVSATSSFAELSSLISKGNYNIGDEITVNAGMVIPVDGIVLSGNTDIEQSAITGESMPVSITSGNSVWAGSVVLDGSIVIKATSSSGTSRIDEVIRLVETAQNKKANIEKTVDKIARYFVPVVITLAVITFLYWSPERGSHHALMMAITVVIIACPWQWV